MTKGETMDKLTMAHEYMQNTLKLLREHNIQYDFKSLIEESFDYADDMQAEADKRKPKTPDVTCKSMNERFEEHIEDMAKWKDSLRKRP